MLCCDDVEDTDGRLEPRMLFRLELSRYGTLLLVIGIPPPCETPTRIHHRDAPLYSPRPSRPVYRYTRYYADTFRIDVTLRRYTLDYVNRTNCI